MSDVKSASQQLDEAIKTVETATAKVEELKGLTRQENQPLSNRARDVC